MISLRVFSMVLVLGLALTPGKCDIKKFRLTKAIRNADDQKQFCVSKGYPKDRVKYAGNERNCNFVCYPPEPDNANFAIVYQPNLTPCSTNYGKCLEGECQKKEVVDGCFAISSKTRNMLQFGAPECVQAICEDKDFKELGRLNKKDGSACYMAGSTTQGTCKQGKCAKK